MATATRRNIRSILSGLQHYLSDMPLPLFVLLFLLSAVYLLLTKIESSDLWWHLACGRYFFENGFYPPPETFTFSPVSGSTSNAHTWLGDLFLYCIHRFSGGEAGLQVFRVIVSCIPVWVFLRFADHRYHTWSLLGSLAIVMGTYQQNLLRNSIFAMIFLPLMVWLWHVAIKNRNFIWLLLYPAILLLWSHMHGYVIVGFYILALFFAGEMIDQILHKDNRNIRFLLVLFIVLGCSWKIVHVNWNINPLSVVQNIQSTLFQNDPPNASSETIDNREQTTGRVKQADASPGTKFRGIINFTKNLFRPFLRGEDANVINEYKSPFDAYGLLPSKVLFLFIPFYLIYLLLAFYYDRRGMKASYILPSLASLFLGLGYVRTLAFPFLVALPLMTAHLPTVLKRLSEDECRFVFIRNFRFTPSLFWILPFVLCIQFALAAHYYYKEKTFYKLTQIFTREPGIGRNILFQATLPDYVLNQFPDENLLNSYSMGGYLIWKWYNKKKVFIDSRSVLYKKDFYDDYNTNYSFRYIDSLGIDKALLNITMDEGRYHAYMSHNWTLIAFDISNVLLQKRTKTGLQTTAGIIPNFLGKPADIDLLPELERHNLGAFFSNTLRYMILFGHLADAIQWTENSGSIIDKFPLDMQQGIQQKKAFMTMLEGHFGRINDPVIGKACRAIEAEDTPASRYLAIGEAYQGFQKNNEAALMFKAAGRSRPMDMQLQLKIGELMLQMNMIDEAINQYQMVVSRQPELVDVCIRLSYFLVIKKDYGQSAHYLKMALANSPKRADIYLNLGLVLKANGELKDAYDIFEKGLSYFPDNARLREELGTTKKN